MTNVLVTKSVEQRLSEIEEQIGFLVDEARARQAARESMSDLATDLTPIARQGMDSVTGLLARAEDKGYVEFAQSGVGVLDRVVTSFTSEDVEALGDNIVLILRTVKEMTQPEIMQMLQSTFHNVQIQDESMLEPPGLLALLRQMREPDARRGLARLLAALRSMGQVPE
ncbi:MAG: DUF1641 domain-containing protein [Acidimicrobiia bacterium]